mgnify:CR=1 FL=1
MEHRGDRQVCRRQRLRRARDVVLPALRTDRQRRASPARSFTPAAARTSRSTGLQGRSRSSTFATNTREWAKLYQPWGINPPGEKFPTSMRPARGAVNDLTPFQKAGAVAVILGWTDVSDANAADQHSAVLPSAAGHSRSVRRPRHARAPALRSARRGREASSSRPTSFPDTPTDTLIATCPGVHATKSSSSTPTPTARTRPRRTARSASSRSRAYFREDPEKRTEAHAACSR